MNEETIKVWVGGRTPVTVRSIVADHLGLQDGQAICGVMLEQIVRSNNALIMARNIMLHANMAALRGDPLAH